jgi:transposase-like protein
MRQFSPEQKQRIIDLYVGGASIRSIVETLHHNRIDVSILLREEGIAIRGYVVTGNDPTPEEIEKAAAEIRKGWQDKTPRANRGDAVHHWTPPVVDCEGLTPRRGY